MSERLSYRIAGVDHVFALERDEIVLGRGEENDLVLEHAAISRKHARLLRDGGGWRLIDLGSTNGTRLRGEDRITRPLRDGDVILLGNLSLTFHGEASAADTPLGGDSVDARATETIYRNTVDFQSLAHLQQEDGGPEGRAERLEKLVSLVSDLSKSLLTGESLENTLQGILDRIFEHLPVQRGFIMVRDEEKDDFVVICSKKTAEAGDGDRLRFSRTIAEKVYREKVTVLTTDAQSDVRFAAGRSVMDLGIRSAMAAPLWNGDQVTGLICVDTSSQAGAFDAFDLDLLSALGNHLAIAIERDRLQELAVEKERLDRELAVAREIQMDILPKELPRVPGYELAGHSRPADETGGDTFDVIPVEDQRLVLLLGDATGHGVGAALSVTQVRSMLRVALRLSATLDDAFRHINDQLVEDLADRRFVTAFLGILDARRHQVRYHSGGQGPIMIYRAAEETFEWRTPSTMPMGFLPAETLGDPHSVTLERGDILGLITDGVFEAEDPSGAFFGTDGVERIVQQHGPEGMNAVRGRLLDAVDSHVRGAPQADDITIVLLRRK